VLEWRRTLELGQDSDLLFDIIQIDAGASGFGGGRPHRWVFCFEELGRWKFLKSELATCDYLINYIIFKFGYKS
jgi:hypothetical protein